MAQAKQAKQTTPGAFMVRIPTGGMNEAQQHDFIMRLFTKCFKDQGAPTDPHTAGQQFLEFTEELGAEDGNDPAANRHKYRGNN